MTRRDMATQATLVLTLVCGIVGGNFLLHRWVIGNATSREAGAGTKLGGVSLEEFDEFAPRRLAISEANVSSDPVKRQERLRKLIVRKLPSLSEADREAWVEELRDLSPAEAEGILDLRSQVGAFPVIDESVTPRSAPVELPKLDFSLDISP